VKAYKEPISEPFIVRGCFLRSTVIQRIIERAKKTDHLTAIDEAEQAIVMFFQDINYRDPNRGSISSGIGSNYP
jgi:hypothetical protein